MRRVARALPALVVVLSWTATAQGQLGLRDMRPITLREVRRVDGKRGMESLGTVAAIAATADGRVLVTGWSPPGVFLLEPGSSQLRRFGRVGEGPGEYRIVAGAGFDGIGIWTVDPSHRRVTWFDASGRVRRTLSGAWLTDRTSQRALAPVGVFADGQIVYAPTVTLDQRAAMADSGFHYTIADSLGQKPRQLVRGYAPRVLGVVQNGREVLLDNPVAPPALLVVFSWTTNLYFVVDAVDTTRSGNASILVTSHSTDGTRRWVRRLNIAPLTPSASSINRFADSLSVLVGGSQHGRIREQMMRDRTKGAPVRAMTGSDGCLWIAHLTEEGRTNWSVLSKDGVLRGVASPPASDRVLAVGCTRVWTVRSVDDEEMIVEYELAGGDGMPRTRSGRSEGDVRSMGQAPRSHPAPISGP